MEERVPEIRFKRFTTKWEQKKLGEIANIIDPHPSHRAPEETKEGVPFIGIGDVEVDGTINYHNVRIVDEKEYEEHHRRYDLAIPSLGIGRVASLGKVIRLRNDIGKYTVSPTLSIMQFNTSSDLDFLFSAMSSPLFQKQFTSLSNGSTRQSVGIQDLRAMEISISSDEDEQKEIGSFFKYIDNLISLETRKLDKLKIFKKACLEKMFPKNGSIVPEIRFAGFAEAWEQRKLGDVARILGGNAWKASDYSDDGEYLVVTIANVSGEVIINDSVGNRISCDNPDVYLLNKGDILVSLTGNVGRVSKMSNIKGLLNQRVGKILPNNSDINADFLFHVLRNPHFERAMIDAGQGAAQKNIRNDDVLNYAFFLPVEKDEQNIIAHYFNRLDNLITLHQRKLDKLKSLKQACLEKMFI